MPGTVWLSIADTDALFADEQVLDPRGGPVTATSWLPWRRGVRVTLNGAPVSSWSHTGITAPLPVRPGTNELVVRSIDRPLWLRVIAIGAPFSESRAIARATWDGRSTRSTVTFTWQPRPATVAAT